MRIPRELGCYVSGHYPRTGFSSILTRHVDQSRKRGTLESDLLMSTFAEAHLRDMSEAQLAQFDLFLDENDWDIYYWATQQVSQTSRETAEGAGLGDEGATMNAAGKEPMSEVAQNTDAGKQASSDTTTDDSMEPREPSSSIGHADAGKQTGPVLETDEWRQGKPRSGEWAQTVGTFKPAYRPVPARWKNSEILAMLRRHVVSRSAGGIHEDDPEVQSAKSTGGGGKSSFGSCEVVY